MLRNSFANVVQGIGNSTNDNQHVSIVPDENQSIHNNSGLSTVNPGDIHQTPVNSGESSRIFSPLDANFVDNNSHPLFLHNNDHPGLVLIAKKLTGPDNYAPWSRSMQIALNARNKFGIVNGSFKKPASTSPLCLQWERVNDLVITWILNSVVDDISDGLNYVTTAAEIWTELAERFSSVNGHRVYQLMKDIHSQEQGNRSVEVYFHKLKGLWDEYAVLEPSVNCTCGAHRVQAEREQKRQLLQFLMGLHDSNSNVRGQILMMSPLPTVSQAFAYVKQDEKARQGFQSVVPDTNALAHSVVTNPLNVVAAANRFVPNKALPQSSNLTKPVLKCSFLITDCASYFGCTVIRRNFKCPNHIH